MTIRLSTGAKTSILSTATFQSTFNLCFADVYTGSQPASADTAPTGTLLGTYSVNHAGTGMTWATAVAGVINKTGAENWQMQASASGAAGWIRFRLTGDLGTTNTTDKRMDMSIASSGGDITLGDTTITSGEIYAITSIPLDMASN